MNIASRNVVPFALLLFGLAFAGANAIRYTSYWRLFKTPPPAVRWGLAALSALGAAFAPGHPTAITAVDVALKAAVGAGIAVLGLRARRWSVLYGGAVASFVLVAAGIADPVSVVALAAGLASLGVALTLRLHHRRSPVLSGVAAALVAQAALRLPPSLPARVPSLAAIAVLAGVVVSGLRHSRTATLRRVRGVVIGLVALAIPAGIAGSLALLQARTDARAGIEGARVALTRAEQADTEGSLEQLQSARIHLAAVRDRTHAWWARPALAVPVLGQHIDAVDRLATSATDVVVAAEEVATSARVDDLRLTGGRIDLDALDAVGQPLERLGGALDGMEDGIRRTRGPWVLPQLRREVDKLDREMTRARSSTDTLREALAVVPAMLGADGPRRYLLVVPTPSEARGSGGVIGNYGEIVADRGSLTLARFGRTDDLKTAGVPPAQRKADAPADYLDRYLPFQANALWQNTNMSPDFPSSARAMASLYPQSGGQTVDGVLSVDPLGLAALLQVIGPVSVPDWPTPISADNAAKTLLYDVYISLGDNRSADRAALLAQVSQTVWSRLTAMALPAPASLASALGPAARGRHIQFWSTRTDEQTYLARLGVSGAVAPLAGDFVGVTVNNASANKIEWFLHRSLTYEARFDPRTRTVRSVLRVQLRNEAPGSGQPDYVIGNFISPPQPKGTSLLFVSVYSPLSLLSSRVDGTPVTAEAGTEVGRRVYSYWVTIPPSSTKTLELDLGGEVAATDDTYRLDVLRQPLIWPDELDVRVRPAGAARVVRSQGLTVGPDGAVGRVDQTEPATFTATVAKPAFG